MLNGSGRLIKEQAAHERQLVLHIAPIDNAINGAVIEQTVREKLPEGFQRSEFLLEHGAIDRIIDRRDMKHELALMCRLFLNQPA
jgi:hypothetical protein